MREDVNVLVVSDDARQLWRWSTWLEQAGWTALVCPGPRVMWGCPRLDGEPCPRRELADVAVVAPSADDWDEERVCTKVPDDGRTVVLGQGAVPHSVRERGVDVSEPAPGLLIDAVRNAFGRCPTESPAPAG